MPGTMTESPAAPDEKRMRLRYVDVCHLCGAQLATGEPAVYERAARRVRCIADGWGGFIDGAIESGLSAACSLLRH